MSAAARLHFLVPGDPDTRTGGYLYDARIRAGLLALGWDVRHHRLADSFPFPDDDALAAVDDRLRSLEDGALALVDGLALGAMPAVAERHRHRLRLVGLVHHPLADETGLDADTAAALRESERHALGHVRAVVATSAFTARALAAGYGVPADRLHVVEPGTEPAPPAAGSGAGCAMLCVATLTPRKGHRVLIEALAGLRDRDWHLHCVGDATRDPATAAAVHAAVTAAGLADRVTFEAEVDDATLAARYHAADLLVMATLHEGYGMALAEALARGLPVVSTTAGAVPDTVGGEAGLLVPPGDAAALRGALGRFLDDAALRARLRAGAARRRRELPSWTDSARRMADLLRAVAGAR